MVVVGHFVLKRLGNFYVIPENAVVIYFQGAYARRVALPTFELSQNLGGVLTDRAVQPLLNLLIALLRSYTQFHKWS